jgi:H+/Cl- antiporter ClcA
MIIVGVLTWVFMQPLLKPLHSLSLETFAEIQNGHVRLDFLVLKIVFTLIFISLGFIGGDFVPLVIVGSGFGVLVAQLIGVPYQFGLVLGCMSFFTGVTRLKWTSLVLVYLLTGFSVMLWAYVCLSMTRHISGPVSLYRKVRPPL